MGSEKDSQENRNVWYPVAKKIQEIVASEKAIVYCAYANDCENLSLSFSQLGLKSSAYTGNLTSAKDKIEIYRSMKEGNIDILVATKAFGMGVNLQDIRHIIHIGIPENLSLWVQELGRAGRDGKQAHATMLVCEYQDIKKLHFWTKLSSERERLARVEDFCIVWEYIATAFVGGCLRKFQMEYFEDQTALPSQLPDLCCTGCDVRKNIPFMKKSKEILCVLKCIDILNKKGMQYVYEGKIVDWLAGSEKEQWIWQYFNRLDLEEEPSFGFLSENAKSDVETCVKGLLRQCLALSYVSLDFNNLPGNTHIIAKSWMLTDSGRNIMDHEGATQIPNVPDLIMTTELLFKYVTFFFFFKELYMNLLFSNYRCQEKVPDSEKKKRSKKGIDIVNQTMNLLKQKSEWVPLQERKQYEMLGYFHDTSKLLFIEDYTQLKCCPTVKKTSDYLWNDIHLSKKSSFPKLEFNLGKDHENKSVFVLYRSKCAGVKVNPIY